MSIIVTILYLILYYEKYPPLTNCFEAGIYTHKALTLTTVARAMQT